MAASCLPEGLLVLKMSLNIYYGSAVLTFPPSHRP